MNANNGTPIAAFFTLVLGCGPIVSSDAEEVPSTDSSPNTSAPPSHASSSGSIATSGQAPPTSVEPDTTSSGPGNPFVIGDDVASTIIECTTWEENCPSGQKCMPWSSDGSGSWNALKCSPIAPIPDAVGAPCTVEGSGVSGIDSCQLGSMCWNVDGETLEGTCTVFCTGSESKPGCGDPLSSCYFPGSGIPSLCLPYCDLLEQDCGPGMGCYLVDSSFVCAPDASGDDAGGYGDPCEFVNSCSAGFLCIGAENFGANSCEANQCCAPVCDATAPDCPDAGTCESLNEAGQVPPGGENVGVCVAS